MTQASYASMPPRDPKRISTILGLLEHYWRRYPDLRLGQILGNAAGRDPYYYEDDMLLLQLGKWLEENA